VAAAQRSVTETAHSPPPNDVITDRLGKDRRLKEFERLCQGYLYMQSMQLLTTSAWDGPIIADCFHPKLWKRT